MCAWQVSYPFAKHEDVSAEPSNAALECPFSLQATSEGGQGLVLQYTQLMVPMPVSDGPFIKLSALLQTMHCAPTKTLIMNIARIFAANVSNSPLLLEGPPGIGKTAVVNQVAMLLGVECERINFSSNTTIEHLYGSMVPRCVEGNRIFQWQDGKLLQALKQGKYHSFNVPQLQMGVQPLPTT